MVNFEEFKKFIMLLKENLEVYLKIMKELLIYTDVNHGKIDTEKLYDVLHFGGVKDKSMYYKKYMSYKKKYLDLKRLNRL